MKKTLCTLFSAILVVSSFSACSPSDPSADYIGTWETTMTQEAPFENGDYSNTVDAEISLTLDFNSDKTGSTSLKLVNSNMEEIINDFLDTKFADIDEDKLDEAIEQTVGMSKDEFISTQIENFEANCNRSNDFNWEMKGSDLAVKEEGFEDSMFTLKDGKLTSDDGYTLTKK